MLRTLIFALLLSALVSHEPSPSSGNTQGEHQAHAAQHHADTQSAERGTKNAPLVIQIQQSGDQNSIAPETKEQGDWYARPDWWVAGFTGALFVATAGLWFFTALMWRATKNAAQAAVQAAEALPIVERAYVYPEVVSAGALDQVLKTAYSEQDPKQFDIEVDVTSEVTFVVKNFGKTPAILRNVMAGFGREETAVFELITIREAILGTQERTGDLTVALWPSFTPNQAAKILSGSEIVIFAGTIVFDDVWGTRFVTEFQFDWDPQDRVMRLTKANVVRGTAD